MHGAPEVAKFFDPSIDILDAPSEQIANSPAGRCMVFRELPRDQLLNVLEGQAERLRLLDESDLMQHSV